MSEIKLCDRTGWPKGPWDNEPDAHEWTHQGYQCKAIRNPIGAWCGYVILPDDHPWVGLDREKIPTYVHGGVSMSSRRGKSWVIGFDCAHGGLDILPGADAMLEMARKADPKVAELFEQVETLRKNLGVKLNEEYRTLKFVIAETERLVHQARAAQAKEDNDVNATS